MVLIVSLFLGVFIIFILFRSRRSKAKVVMSEQCIHMPMLEQVDPVHLPATNKPTIALSNSVLSLSGDELRRVIGPPALPPIPEVAVRFHPIPEETIREISGLDIYNPADGFECDLGKQTCTCPEFMIYRKEFASGDPLRLCEHLRHSLMEEGAITLAEPMAGPLWLKRGGRIYQWSTVDGQGAYIFLDLLQREINLERKLKRASPQTHCHGYIWYPADGGWKYGRNPSGITRVLIPVLRQMVAYREELRREVGHEIEIRWEANRVAYDAQVMEQAQMAEEFARQNGLLCGVCNTPFGQPWGLPLCTEITCKACGFLNIVVANNRADAKERALIDWKYYGDPRPGGCIGLLALAKQRLELGRTEIYSKNLSGQSRNFSYVNEADRLTQEYLNENDGIHEQRHAELKDIRRRIRNAKEKLKRKAERETKNPSPSS